MIIDDIWWYLRIIEDESVGEDNDGDNFGCVTFWIASWNWSTGIWKVRAMRDNRSDDTSCDKNYVANSCLSTVHDKQGNRSLMGGIWVWKYIWICSYFWAMFANSIFCRNSYKELDSCSHLHCSQSTWPWLHWKIRLGGLISSMHTEDKYWFHCVYISQLP